MVRLTAIKPDWRSGVDFHLENFRLKDAKSEQNKYESGIRHVKLD